MLSGCLQRGCGFAVTGIVKGRGKRRAIDAVEYYDGEETVAVLVRPIWGTGPSWWVLFPWDRPQGAKPSMRYTRCRTLVRRLT
jgi:hypothetical protein